MSSALAELDTVTDISTVLGAPLWQRHTIPFPHWVVYDVFSAAVYRRLAEDFWARMHPSETTPAARRFGRPLPTSEATALLFDPDFSGPLGLFLSRPWRELISTVTAIPLTEHVSGGLHHHRVGDPDGFIHNDLKAGWFVDRPRPDGTVVADHNACRYGTGEPRRAGVTAQPQIRAVSLLYYLANPPWTAADGGGTGLFAHRDDPLGHAAAVVPPINNSLAIFPCTPYSFHSYLSNRRSPRSSVAMWFHRSPADAAAQWGERIIARALNTRTA